MTNDDHKRQAAREAIDLVDAGMTIGVGTGSTAAHFIVALAERFGSSDDLGCVPTSEATRRALHEAGLLIVEPDEATRIDIAVDGADEIGPGLALIKGGGGALLREKIVAQSAGRFVVIADESKVVSHLGAFALPLEIEPALYGLTIARVRTVLADIGYSNPVLRLRSARDGAGPFMTDGGRYVLDADLGRIDRPEAVDGALRPIAGVVETGLFTGLVDHCIVAGPSGIRRLTTK